MTTESTITKQLYQGNGAATVWPVPFQYSRAETIFLTLADAAGNETPVTGNFQVVVGNGATSIKYPASGNPVPSGTRLAVYRKTPKTQIVDLYYGGAFSPEVIERDGFDRVVMMIQELQEELGRCLKYGMFYPTPLSAEEYMRQILESLAAAAASAAQSAGSANQAAGYASASAASAAQSAGFAADSAASAQNSADFAGNSAASAADAASSATAAYHAVDLAAVQVDLADAQADRAEACMIQSCACAADARASKAAAKTEADRAADVVSDVTEKLNGIMGLFNNLFAAAMECCGSVEDYRYTFEAITEDGDYGLITGAVTQTEDWGGLTGLFHAA